MSKIEKTPGPAAGAESIDLYWHEIKDNTPLTQNDEYQLFKRMRAGDRQAYDQLVQANLRFVVRVAREYCPEDGPLFMDMVAEGNMGLLRALESFDEDRGFKFITYAVWWIRQTMLKALPRSTRAARLPMGHVNDMHKIEKITARLSQQLGQTPTLDHIADRAEMAPERVLNAMSAGLQDLSFDAPLFEEDDQPLLGAFAEASNGAEELENKEDFEILTQSLQTLNDREALIVQDYFGLEKSQRKTLEEIGSQIGVTRERVRQIKNRALEKLRTRFDQLQVEVSPN